MTTPFWAVPTSREALLSSSSYVTIAGLLKLPEAGAQDQPLIVGAVQRWLSSHERCKKCNALCECLRMPGPKKDAQGLITESGDMVVYCAGFPAIYGRQPLYFQDETLSRRQSATMQSFLVFRCRRSKFSKTLGHLAAR
jgi:hypothetical protein